MNGSLYDYLWHEVIITTTDGKQYRGYADYYESETDNEIPEEAFGILSDGLKSGYWFNASQIKSVVIVDEPKRGS